MNTPVLKMLALGPAGTNGHEAAHQILRRLGDKTLVLPDADKIGVELCDSHATVFRRAIDEHCYGIVPIESMKSLVDDTIDGFWLRYPFSRTTISVIGEVHLPIEHVLVMRPEMTLDESTPVLSHPQALSQCRGNLKALGLKNFVSTNSTAGAGKIIAEDDRHAFSAALVSPFAATVYRLQVINPHMADSRGSITRFHLLGHQPWRAEEGCKTALIFWTMNQPGALWSALGAFAKNNVNMTSIHSIPLGTAGEYAFYVEFDEHTKTKRGIEIMAQLTAATDRILLLGSFPREEKVST
jgi:prephenate dehydratase